MRFAILLIVFFVPVSFAIDYKQEIIDHALSPCLKARLKTHKINPDIYERFGIMEHVNLMNDQLNKASLSFDVRKEIYDVIKDSCASNFSDPYGVQRKIDSIVEANTKNNPYKPLLISLLILLPIGLWVCFDARTRKNNSILWPIFVVMIGIFTLPVYLAKRNLKEGEIREGGFAWNVLKYFAIIWTIVILTAAIIAICLVLPTHTATMGPFQSFITAMLAMSMYGFIWFGVMISALVIGLFLKRNSVIEKGPTGALIVKL